MTEEFYRPTIIQPKDIEIEGTDYNADLNIIKEGNTIKVTMDQDVMIQRVSHEIYSNFESGIRELINNEFRACRQARDKYNAKPKVEVRINKSTRLLTIEGIDSLGVSIRVFDKVLRRLGVSGNVDGGNEIGQFGMGFASYTTLSEMINVETYSREDGQQFSFLGDRGIDFKILPKPDRETFGTKISITCNESVRFKNVIEKVKECATFSTIPTTIIIDDSGDNESWGDRIEEGITECEQYNSGKEYVIANCGFCPTDNIKWYKEIHIDNEDYEFFGVIAISNHIIKHRTNKRLLVNTPIDMHLSLPCAFTGVYFNVKNERKCPPTADRDRLKDNSLDNINSELKEKIKEHFSDIGINSVKEYHSTLDRAFYDNIYSYQECLDENVYNVSNGIVRILDRRLATVNGRYVQLKTLIVKGNTIIVLKSLRSDMMSRLSSAIDGEIEFIRYNPTNHDSSNNEVYNNAFKELGIIYGEQYIKDNKVKGITKVSNEDVKTVTANKPCVLYHKGNHYGSDLFGCNTRYYVEKYSTIIGDVNNNADPDKMMIVSKDDWNNIFNNIMYHVGQEFVIMKPHKGLSDEIDNYTDLAKEYNTNQFHTLGGKTIGLSNLKGTVVLTVTSKGKEMSNMFSDDNLTEENKERDLTVLFLSSVKELICIYNILNIKDGVRPQFYRTDDIEELFNDNRITTLDIKGSTDNLDSLMMIETFRRKVTKEQYYMFLMAIKSDDTMADKFMDIILECSS